MHTKPSPGFLLKLFTSLLAGTILFSGCTPNMIQATADPSPIPVLITSTPTVAISTARPASNPGTTVSFEPLTVVVPQEVASGASGKEYPRLDTEDAAWWQKTPGHLEVMLGDYYVLQGKFHQPQIYVYPAQAYAELVPPAFESLHRLNNILGISGVPINADQLPTVPFFNAQQVFASNIQVISFQNGSGVRFLTQYSQSPAPVNNHELFYQFQGVTSDGTYHIIAILPITASFLAENSDLAATMPIGGIDYPDMSSSNPDWQGYYSAATESLNATPLNSFTPEINQLDLMIQSIEITQ